MLLSVSERAREREREIFDFELKTLVNPGGWVPSAALRR